MEILLMCKNSSGSVAFSAGLVEGISAPTRKYLIEGGAITLSGYSDAILHHDCEELLHMPSGLYRMPTPAEQEAMLQKTQQASQLQENVSATTTEQGDDSDTDNAPVTPPAQDSKKKSGD
ncbi:MAG TPA: hypothetical protein VFN23_10525 [Ktedonobacteraceae bacterium]|nr:hypothetical protein [Ktedonobacteraceae bacterium]